MQWKIAVLIRICSVCVYCNLEQNLIEWLKFIEEYKGMSTAQSLEECVSAKGTFYSREPISRPLKNSYFCLDFSRKV